MTPRSPVILLVEDDRDSRLLLSEVIALSGYRVIEAEGYRAALGAMEREPADVAIIDLRLPDGNGIDLMHDLRKRYADVITLVSTGHGTLQTAVEAIKEGAYAYFLKPYDPQDLLNMIRQATEKWRLQHLNRQLLYQARAENERVKALLQAAEEINAALLDTVELGRRIVQTAQRIMEAGVGLLGLLEGAEIVVHEWWDGARWHPLEKAFGMGEGGPGYVWQTRTTYRSDDAQNDPLLAVSISRLLGRRTMICSPIMTRHGEFLGVLDLSDRSGGEPFTDDDARFLEGLGRHIAIALENARLYEEQRRSEERRKQFYRDVVCSATQNKLFLCDPEECPTPAIAPRLRMPVNGAEDIGRIRDSLTPLLAGLPMDEERRADLLVCVGEAATNAYRHGGGGEVLVWLLEDHLLIRVEDHGPGFEESTLPRATLLAGYSTQASLGMGMTLILNFVDRAHLSTGPAGTRLDMQISYEPMEVDPWEAFAAIL